MMVPLDDVCVLKNDAKIFSVSNDLLLNFCIIGVAFLVVHLIVSHASLLGSAPIFSDDFDGFGSTLNNIRTSWFRPLSTVLWSFLCALGPKTFFLIAEVWIVAYIALVFTYTKVLFGIAGKAFELTLVAAIIAVCFEYLTHYFYFSGAVLGVMSGAFAVASMLAFLSAQKERFKTVWLALPVVLGVASLLCKEDFALPILLFFCFQFATNHGETRRSSLIVLISTAVAIGALFVVQKVIAPSQFFSGQSVHYEMGLSVPSIVDMYRRYLFCTKGAIIACLAQIAGSLFVCCTGSTKSKINVALLNLQTLSLVGPFSLLPNHFLEFYAQGWICFQSAFVLLFAIPLAREMRISRWLGASVAVCLAGGIIWVTQAQRDALFGWYGKASRLSNNEDASLLKFKTEINNAKTVVVIDPPACNAWLRTDGSYLRNRLGLDTNWTVLAKRDSELGKLVKQFADLQHPGIDWQIYDNNIPTQPENALFLKFDEDANASLMQCAQRK